MPLQQQQATELLDKLRDLIISYTGLTLQEPEMFPQPNIPGKEFGAQELIPSFMSLSALSGPYLSASSTNLLDASEIELFLQDLVRRFEPDNEIDSVLGPVVVKLCWHESLAVGFASGDGWRGVTSGLEALVSVKPIATMITRLPEWNPEVSASEFESKSLMGPLLRLGVFHREWVTQRISQLSLSTRTDPSL